MVGLPYSRKDPVSHTVSSSTSHSVTGGPLDLYPALLVCVLVLQRHLVSYSYKYGDANGPPRATRVLSFL